jgi:hypothetical protein
MEGHELAAVTIEDILALEPSADSTEKTEKDKKDPPRLAFRCSLKRAILRVRVVVCGGWWVWVLCKAQDSLSLSLSLEREREKAQRETHYYISYMYIIIYCN